MRAAEAEQLLSAVFGLPSGMAEEVEEAILKDIGSHGEIADTGQFSSDHNFDHQKLTGVALSLESIGFILKKVCL